ncbi:coadhesin-like [Tubulanus polymorphus]|uniref:coadhesin-like n=1 Tax=Tubulanus polymorphus TaxID=672921 RepID=UPI003DA474A7
MRRHLFNAENVWGEWGHYGRCDACGDGTKTRTRNCTDEADNAVPVSGCPGENFESVACNYGACVNCDGSATDDHCPIDGNWSDWGNYGSCSVTCGEGTKTRTRTCTNPAPSNGGAVCVGDNSESTSCNDGPCPVDGNWSNWESWGDCDIKLFDCGERTRSRTCTNPAPANGGADCVGDSKGEKACRWTQYGRWPWMRRLNAEDVWSEWGSYGSCDACGDGTKTRARNCTDDNGNVVTVSRCTGENL